MRRTVVAALLAASAAVAWAPSAGAASAIDAQRAQIRILEAELSGVQERAAAAGAAEQEARAELERLRGRIRANQIRLTEARADHKRSQRILSERLVAIYREDRPSTVVLLLTAGSISRTLASYELLDRTGTQDALVVESLESTRDRVARARQSLLTDRRRARSARVMATARRRELEDLAAQRYAVLVQSERTLSRLIAEEQARQAAAREAARIAALRAAQARARAAIASSPSEGATAQPVVYTGGAPAPSTLESIAECESGGNPRAISPGGTYRGKYQFLPETWRSLGGRGDPAAAPEAEQDRLAALLYAQRGSSPWPICGG